MCGRLHDLSWRHLLQLLILLLLMLERHRAAAAAEVVMYQGMHGLSVVRRLGLVPRMQQQGQRKQQQLSRSCREAATLLPAMAPAPAAPAAAAAIQLLATAAAALLVGRAQLLLLAVALFQQWQLLGVQCG